MDTGQIIIFGVIGLAIQYIIIAYAVHNATSVLRQQAKIQTALLCEMARKAGVTESEIQQALDTK